MATKGVNPQNRGEVNPMEGNKQKKNGSDAQNRRALVDIGNLATIRGFDVKLTNRRGVCAPLVANAQAKAGSDHNNIDAVDAGNELAAVEYVEDLYKFYKLIEEEIIVPDYMATQPEINEKMRAILIDWLIEVQQKFDMLPETLYLTVNIVDRFLAVKSVPRRELQLVGISAMLMASKYEEIWTPEVSDFVRISDSVYSHEQILKMEKSILGKLEYTLTVATSYVFLVRYIKASIADYEMEQMSHFLSELGMMHYGVAVMYRPSLVSASAVYAARCTLTKSPAWDATLELHTGYSETQLVECANLLVGFHSTASKADSKLKAVYRKYANPKRVAVALMPPAKSLASS